MMKIKHTNIENALEYFENKQFSDKSEKEILNKFPEIMSYLTSNQFSVLSDDEYMILSFNILILLKTLMDTREDLPEITDELIELNETKNWENLEKAGNIPIEEKIYLLFGEDNKDLAEFILAGFSDEEDEDEDVEISIPAQEIIFISVKTIFDCFRD
ncbi:MAG TPA: hypothetical protein ENI82_00375 [Bacteroidetes bacterium]|nr:hypothetical protein [Bacteroidota bacterium]